MLISLDSPIKEKHDLSRGVKVFDKAMETIKIAKSLDLLVGISTYATRASIENNEVLDMLELGKKLGVNEIVIFDCVPTGKLISCGEVMLGQAEHDYLVKLQDEINRSKTYPRLSTMSFVNSGNAFGCFAGFDQLHITNSGYVTPCDFTPLSFGNVKEESIKKIWKKMRNHPEYRIHRMKCRMQTPEFREKYIDKIPSDANLPYPINRL